MAELELKNSEPYWVLPVKPYSNKSLLNMEGELWKEYHLNPQYLVSNLGRIKSKEQIVSHSSRGLAIKKEKILTQTDNGSGYLSVGLTENKKTKTTRVSRVVALTWIPNPENKPQVNHKKGIKYDNRSFELEWNTTGENVRHAWNNGLAKKQSSFLYIKERLKVINSYLSNSLKVSTPIGIGVIIIDQSCYRIQYDNGKIENLIKSLRFWKDDFKLVLHNLSDLTKEIEHNGREIIPFDELEFFYKDFYFAIGNEDELIVKYKNTNMYVLITEYNNIIEKLYEWHFDIHGLIEKGLAIDINTLK